jgi:hypothetical protein
MIPRRFDVLFGRGATIAEHTGNLRAFHIVEMNRGRYEKAGKFEKIQIADRVVHLIHTTYGRFLRKKPGGWVAVNRDDKSLFLTIARIGESNQTGKRGRRTSSSDNATKRDSQRPVHRILTGVTRPAWM